MRNTGTDSDVRPSLPTEASWLPGAARSARIARLLAHALSASARLFVHSDQRGQIYAFHLADNRWWLVGRQGVAGTAIAVSHPPTESIVAAFADSEQPSCRLVETLTGVV